MQLKQSEEPGFQEDRLEFERMAKAAYMPGQYYFYVRTGKYRADLGLGPGDPITPAIQATMQLVNRIPLFHEYIHYIHEISTMTGGLGLGLDTYQKSIFSHYFDKNLTSCQHFGIDRDDPHHPYHKDNYVSITGTIANLNGSVEKDCEVRLISHIVMTSRIAYIPAGTELQPFEFNLPVLTVNQVKGGKSYTADLFLGKYFLYEGLAYELDQEIQRQQFNLPEILDGLKYTEYTVLRLVARHLYPSIKTKDFLTIASLSLSYLNAGEMFVAYVQRLRNEVETGSYINDIIDRMRNEVSQMLLKQLADFHGAQQEIIDIFRYRTQLYKAFSYIGQQLKNGYTVRAENPVFEVDLIYNGQTEQLLDIIPICDYMYQFSDIDLYDRDFFGTASMDEETSLACRVLIAYDHYQKTHTARGVNKRRSTVAIEQEITSTCPFFSCCNLAMRRHHENICYEKPWRIFEISGQTDQQYCSYGTAVGEFKGRTERSL